MRRFPFALAVAAGAAVALAGCGASASAPRAAESAASPAGSAPATSPSAPALSNRQRAEADAAGLLASFAIPPGAVQLQGPPGLGGGILRADPVFTGTSPYAVDRAGWWRAPGDPLQVIRWEQAHLPHRFTPNGSTATDAAPGQEAFWFYQFALPPVPGVLDTRQLVVEVASAGGGQTYIRADGLVTWLPPRPATEAVPSTASVATISETLGSADPGATAPAPVTITDLTVVRKLTAAVDGLPLVSPIPRFCVADLGAYLTVSFRARPGGPALATARVDLTGCGTVGFAIGGEPQPALGAYGGGRTVAAQLLRLAGLRWKVP